MSHCSKQLTDLTILNQWRLHWINFNKRGDLKEFGPTYEFLWNKLIFFIFGQNIQLELITRRSYLKNFLSLLVNRQTIIGKQISFFF